MREKIGFISLGCPKNQVDTELMLNKLEKAGFEITESVLGVDVIIVNTCGFIEDAKKESVDNILEAAELKKQGETGKIIVIGCLAERYRDKILEEIPEADAVGGLGVNGDIVSFVEAVLAGNEKSRYPEKLALPLNGERLLTTPPYWAYIKIAEGCSNRCSYCAVPSIRGPFRSRLKEDILSEASSLAESGVKELIVIAQDVTSYGRDIYGKLCLDELLSEMCKIEKLRWIRLLYCYPDFITDSLLETLRDNDKILKYIDVPFQHASGKILKAMNRRGDKTSELELIKKIRSYMPECVIRSTLITGFPGETDEDFEILSEFVNEAKFDRLGCFAYSLEEGTPAFLFPDRVEKKVAQRRKEIITEQQYRIFSEKLERLVGTTLECIVENYDGYTDSYLGRTWMDAPEIDTEINFVCDRELPEGEIVEVKITNVNGLGLLGDAK